MTGHTATFRVGGLSLSRPNVASDESEITSFTASAASQDEHFCAPLSHQCACASAHTMSASTPTEFTTP